MFVHGFEDPMELSAELLNCLLGLSVVVTELLDSLLQLVDGIFHRLGYGIGRHSYALTRRDASVGAVTGGTVASSEAC